MSQKALCEKRKSLFVKALGETMVISYAAKAAGITRQTAYNWRENDRAFARAWDEAYLDCVDNLEAEGYRRAMDGSDTMLIFYLKGARPEKYGDRRHITGNVNISLDAFIAGLDDDDVESGFDEPTVQ